MGAVLSTTYLSRITLREKADATGMCGSAGIGAGGGGPDDAKACAGVDGGRDRDSLGAVTD